MLDHRACLRAGAALALVGSASACRTVEPTAGLKDAVGSSGLPVGLWRDATDATIGATDEWSNKVELGDVNNDGLVDIVFANGGDYASPGAIEPTRIFLNQGPGQPFREATQQLFGAADPGNHARAVRIVDVNGDGRSDVFVANAYGQQSRLFLGAPSGGLQEVTATHLPQAGHSFGDAQFGDIDGNGTLDMVAIDWGPGTATSNQGGPLVVWLGDGQGHFAPAPTANVPTKKHKMSWSIALVDVNNDFALDVGISCKLCSGSSLYLNDGSGKLVDASDRLPQFSNNYDFQPIDVNRDGFFDLITINDGAGLTAAHVFVNDGTGRFLDKTAELWPAAENEPGDDNINNVLDFNSDGCADFVTGALAGPDRLNLNDCSGHFRAATNVFLGDETPGTLGMQMADLNQDGRLDVVMAQGESVMPDVVFLATEAYPKDSRAPMIGPVELVAKAPGMRVRARVHDNKTPVKPFDFKMLELVWEADGQSHKQPLTWTGEAEWSATIAAVPAGALRYQVCATDAAGNAACSPMQSAL